MFATYGRENKGQLSISLTDNLGNELLSVQEDTSQFSDNSYRNYSLEKPVGTGPITLRLNALNSFPGNTITAWARDHPIIPMTIGDKEVDGQLCLMLYFESGKKRHTPGCAYH